MFRRSGFWKKTGGRLDQGRLYRAASFPPTTDGFEAQQISEAMFGPAGTRAGPPRAGRMRYPRRASMCAPTGLIYPAGIQGKTLDRRTKTRPFTESVTPSTRNTGKARRPVSFPRHGDKRKPIQGPKKAKKPEWLGGRRSDARKKKRRAPLAPFEDSAIRRPPFRPQFSCENTFMGPQRHWNREDSWWASLARARRHGRPGGFYLRVSQISTEESAPISYRATASTEGQGPARTIFSGTGLRNAGSAGRYFKKGASRESRRRAYTQYWGPASAF